MPYTSNGTHHSSLCANLSSLCKFQRYQLPISSTGSRFPKLAGLWLPMKFTGRDAPMLILCRQLNLHRECTDLWLKFVLMLTLKVRQWPWFYRPYIVSQVISRFRNLIMGSIQEACLEHITLRNTWTRLLGLRYSQQPAMTMFLFGYTILRAAFPSQNGIRGRANAGAEISHLKSI